METHFPPSTSNNTAEKNVLSFRKVHNFHLVREHHVCVRSALGASERVCVCEREKELGSKCLFNVSVYLCVCLCIYSSERACPLTGCVCRGPSPPSGGGPGVAVALPRARHAMCSWARASCAAWSGSPGTWAAGRGEDGGEGGRQEAALVSSLSSLANGDGGGKAQPFPPLPMGAIIHIILANHKNRK